LPGRRDSAAFTGDAFRELLRQLMLPTGIRGRYPIDPGAERDARKLVGIIDSMTSEERLSPGQITEEGRQRRIAGGAGVTLSEVADFVRQFDAMSQIMGRIRRMRGR
jgi:signal recognition particle GTPase